MHHAGLAPKDRKVVEELFVGRKIMVGHKAGECVGRVSSPSDTSLYELCTQVLITTSTLAWGVNYPAHLVVIKGTEYFDAKTGRYGTA